MSTSICSPWRHMNELTHGKIHRQRLQPPTRPCRAHPLDQQPKRNVCTFAAVATVTTYALRKVITGITVAIYTGGIRFPHSFIFFGLCLMLETIECYGCYTRNSLLWYTNSPMECPAPSEVRSSSRLFMSTSRTPLFGRDHQSVLLETHILLILATLTCDRMRMTNIPGKRFGSHFSHFQHLQVHRLWNRISTGMLFILHFLTNPFPLFGQGNCLTTTPIYGKLGMNLAFSFMPLSDFTISQHHYLMTGWKLDLSDQ